VFDVNVIFVFVV